MTVLCYPDLREGAGGEVSIGTDRQTEERTDRRTDMASPGLHPCFPTLTGLRLCNIKRYRRQEQGEGFTLGLETRMWPGGCPVYGEGRANVC